MLSSPGTGLSLWAGVVRVVDDDEEDDKEDDDMMSIAVCLSSYSLFSRGPFFLQSMIMVPSLNKNGWSWSKLLYRERERERGRGGFFHFLV